MRFLFIALLSTAACQFDTSAPGTGATGDGDGGAGGVDASVNPQVDGGITPNADANLGPDATPAVACDDWLQLPSFFDPCTDIPVVSDDLILNEVGEYSYDTDLGTLTSPNDNPVAHTSVLLASGAEGARVIVAGAIEVRTLATLRATGSRPLLIVSWEDISIAGVVDVSSGAELGAGANPSVCSAATPGGDDTDGGGGGGGGAFGGAGGDGADARDGTDAAGGSGATASAVPGFRGGCAGARGGNGQSALGGAAGNGGGAVYLVARKTLTIGGRVLASGEGGFGSGGDRSGGAGGGSGGMIGFEAVTLNLLQDSVIAANGGGGGGGSNQNTGAPGQSGLPEAQPAIGGDGESTPAGDGGNGGYSAVLAGQDGTTSDRGGGGGGGGAGFVLFVTDGKNNTGSLISPQPTQ